NTASICRPMTEGESGSPPRIPEVSGAVTATTTVAAWSPWAANVSRSAWMPAPPPESDAAIVAAVMQPRLFRISARERIWPLFLGQRSQNHAPIEIPFSRARPARSDLRPPGRRRRHGASVRRREAEDRHGRGPLSGRLARRLPSERPAAGPRGGRRTGLGGIARRRTGRRLARLRDRPGHGR